MRAEEPQSGYKVLMIAPTPFRRPRGSCRIYEETRALQALGCQVESDLPPGR